MSPYYSRTANMACLYKIDNVDGDIIQGLTLISNLQYVIDEISDWITEAINTLQVYRANPDIHGEMGSDGKTLSIQMYSDYGNRRMSILLLFSGTVQQIDAVSQQIKSNPLTAHYF